MLLKGLASELDLLFKWKFKTPVITISWVTKASSSKYADHSVKNVEFLNPFCGDYKHITSHLTYSHRRIHVFRMDVGSLSLVHRHIKP